MEDGVLYLEEMAFWFDLTSVVFLLLRFSSIPTWGLTREGKAWRRTGE